MFKRRIAHTCAAAFVVMLLGSSVLKAGETGIAAIHQWAKVGRKTCIADHWHHGEGSGPTKKAAEAKAIKMWVDFTAVDYGTDWMHFKLAEAKSIKCERSGAGWTCSADARACKITKRAGSKKKK